jgi:hypothetical protein
MYYQVQVLSSDMTMMVMLLLLLLVTTNSQLAILVFAAWGIEVIPFAPRRRFVLLVVGLTWKTIIRITRSGC